jgi:hypothetical protein
MARTVLPRYLLLTFLAAVLGISSGCKSLSYKAWSLMGVEKRDLLVDNVEEARDSQDQAKEQFKTTLERFSSVVNFDGGELEDLYKSLNAEFETSEKRAKDVSNRIHAVEGVANDLFAEWQEETTQYSSASLREKSESMLRETRSRYEQLIAAMRRAESKMKPVLDKFRDHVLFLKHKLNRNAIDSLKDELVTVESNVGELIREMEASIAEANEFIEEMAKTETPS